MLLEVYIQELIMARIFIQTLGIQLILEDGICKTFFSSQINSLLKSVTEHLLSSCFVLCITGAVHPALTTEAVQEDKTSPPRVVRDLKQGCGHLIMYLSHP